MIPKTIHYVWVGDAQKPPDVLACIESWRCKCPGWEIREWGNDFVRMSGNRYALEAFARRKWAFVSDWVRLAVLARHGGFYLDTDVEVNRPFDSLCSENFVAGWERQNGNTLVGSGVIGSVAGGEVVRSLLAMYDDLAFVLPNGELDQTPNTVRFLDYFTSKWNLRPGDGNAEVRFGVGGVILPCSAFVSHDGYALHHFSATWLDAWLRKVWFKAGSYKLVRFKRRREAPDVEISLLDGEREVFSFPLGERKRVLLLESSHGS
jgi:hypothetical protein